MKHPPVQHESKAWHGPIESVKDSRNAPQGRKWTELRDTFWLLLLKTDAFSATPPHRQVRGDMRSQGRGPSGCGSRGEQGAVTPAIAPDQNLSPGWRASPSPADQLGSINGFGVDPLMAIIFHCFDSACTDYPTQASACAPLWCNADVYTHVSVGKILLCKKKKSSRDQFSSIQQQFDLSWLWWSLMEWHTSCVLPIWQCFLFRWSQRWTVIIRSWLCCSQLLHKQVNKSVFIPQQLQQQSSHVQYR